MPGIFISYRREDSAPSAGRLYDHLVEHFGKEHVFRDIDTIAPGAEFAKVIEESIGKCDVLIAVIGRDWLRIKDVQGQRRLDDPDDLVKAEIREALSQNKRVIPVLVEGASMSVAADLPPEIAAFAGRNAIEISESRFDYDVGRLIEAVASTAELAALQPKAMKASVEHSHTEVNPLGMLQGWVRSRWGKRGSILLAIVLGLWGGLDPT
jgi:TIR domain